MRMTFAASLSDPFRAGAAIWTGKSRVSQGGKLGCGYASGTPESSVATETTPTPRKWCGLAGDAVQNRLDVLQGAGMVTTRLADDRPGELVVATESVHSGDDCCPLGHIGNDPVEFAVQVLQPGMWPRERHCARGHLVRDETEPGRGIQEFLKATKRTK